jgi:hypothetical protein
MGTTPDLWLRCQNFLGYGQGLDTTFLLGPGAPWSNYFANGTKRNASAPDYNGYYVQNWPQFAYPTWCADVAGPKNIQCSTKVAAPLDATGKAWPVTCDVIMSENRFDMAVLYSGTNAPASYVPGFGCNCPGLGGCNPGNTALFPSYSLDVTSFVLDLNYINVSMYGTGNYGPTELFGIPFSFANLAQLEPKMLTVTPGSVLGLNNPAAAAIDYQNIGLDIFCSRPSDPSNGWVNCSSDGQPRILARSVCNFTCSPGFTAVGFVTQTMCQANASFYPVRTAIVVVCCD